MNSFVIILNGASSSGKTSIAHAIQRLSSIPILHAPLDTFTDMFCWQAIAGDDQKRECHRVGVANFHATIPILASSQFPLILDHVFEQHEWFEATAAALSDKNVHFIAVRCPLSVLEEREKTRGNRRIGLARFQVDRVHERKVYDLEVDTSIHSAEECAAAILRLVERSSH